MKSHSNLINSPRKMTTHATTTHATTTHTATAHTTSKHAIGKILDSIRKLRIWMLACPLLILAGAPALLYAQQSQPAGPDADTDADDEVVVLEEFSVNASNNPSEYIASEAISGTRTGARILEIPFNVQVLTSELMEDFQLNNEYNALPTVPSYSPGDGDARLRGYSPLTLRDGFSRAGPANIANTRQVEVIMGPQSALYGQASPGGILNYISKRPRRNHWNRLTLAAGNYDYRRAEIEFNGPAVRNKLYYMLNVAYNYREAETDYTFSDRRSYLFGLTWLITKRTSLSINWEQQFIKSIGTPGMPQWVIGGTPNTGNPAASGGTVVGPYEQLRTFNRQGPWQNNHSRFDSLSALVEHRFNHIFSARVNTLYFHRNWDDETWTSGLQLDQSTMRMRARQPYKRIYTIDNYAIQTELLSQFNTGPLAHKFLVAADYVRDIYHNQQFFLPTSGDNVIGNILSLDTRFLDPFNPRWETVDYSLMTRLATDLERIYDHTGVAASLRTFALGQKLITSLSTRYSRTDSDIRDHVTAALSGKSHEDGWIYSLGANYKLLDDAAVLYANTSTSYEPSTTYDRGLHRTVAPEKGNGFETGIKGSFLQQRINYTFSLYYIEKRNVRETNPLYDELVYGSPQYLVAGKIRIRGAELATSMTPVRGLAIMGSASYIDSEITHHENPLAIGKRPEYVPRYIGSLMASYGFSRGLLKGLRIRANSTILGDRISQHDNNTPSTKEKEYITPSLFLLSTGASYEIRQSRRIRHTIALDIQNLLDREYYSPGAFSPGRGRSYSMTYRMIF
jgi:outer membrane receptor protein involved in Fe transport